MKDEKVFNDLYAKLNKAQKEAVDFIDGPVMVIAGPGTGKTQTLTLRIANILRQTDTAPEQILALTFTEAGVEVMRSRLTAIVGIKAYRVPIFTFHGFCNEVIGRFSEYFPQILGSRPASELDRVTIMQNVIDKSNLSRLASFRSSYHYVLPALHAISLLKREAVDSSELRARLDLEEKLILNSSDYRHEKGAHKGKVRGSYIIREAALAKNRELAVLYEGYEMGLAKELLYDFDDMIVTVAKRLEENQDLRLILQEEYQYLSADEHQDANGAQNKVLKLLSSFHESPNLFIVGDEKQAIYRFQGASLENFLYFKRLFPKAKLIVLEENYRSTQSVLDAAHKLVSTEGLRLKAKAGHKEQPITLQEYHTTLDEAEGIAEDVALKIKQGVSPEEIAIFTRTNKELSLYGAALSRHRVSVSVQAKENVVDDPDIDRLVMLIRSAANIGEDGPLIHAFHASCFNIAELDIFLISREASRIHDSVWNLTRHKNRLSTLNLSDPDEVIRVVNLISNWGKLGFNVAPAVLVSTIIRESGIISQILSSRNAEEKLTKVSAILSYLEDYLKTHRGARIGDLLSVLDLLEKYNLLEVKVSSNLSNKVRLSTAHRAKGLEFDHVYVVGANEGNWSGGHSHTDFKLPGMVAITKDDQEYDDCRLFYVALTRARKNLSISYGLARQDGGVLMPTRFIDLLPTELLIKKSFTTILSSKRRANAILPHVLPKRPVEDIRNFVRETLALRGLAVTGLNNYLKCPWQYFYRTLLRIPEPQTVPLMFGNAVHRTLKAFFDDWRDKADMSRGRLLQRFESELGRESLTDKEFLEGKKEGGRALGGYYDFWYPNWRREVKNEFPVDVMVSVSDFDLRLTGKFDRLDLIEDKEVSVIDYKTGKPKTRNHIEGKTASEGSGDYKRQLIFYKLLLDIYDSGRYSMQTGVIDFIEADDKGKYHREEFAITKDEVLELRKTIDRVANEILSLSFWGKRCDDKKCDYCKLRESVK